jgi:hypothetical protein
MTVLGLTVIHTIHIPGVGEIVGGGRRLDRSVKAGKLATMKLSLVSTGVLLEVSGKAALIPFSSIAYVEVASE